VAPFAPDLVAHFHRIGGTLSPDWWHYIVRISQTFTDWWIQTTWKQFNIQSDILL